jgi:hypothetical protein
MTSGEAEVTVTREKPARARLIGGPGMLLVWLYGVMVVGAVSRSVYQIATDATVWSDYGMGYLFIPVLLPLTAMYWLRRARTP